MFPFLLPALVLAPACTESPGEPEPATDTAACPPPGVGPGPAFEFEGAPPRNLVMISIDTLRRDALGRYGGGTDTPFLDDLLERSFVLDQHASCANWTLPGVTCALSGRTPADMGFWPRPPTQEGDTGIPENLRSLALMLEDHGYRTALATASEMLSPSGPLGAAYQATFDERNLPAGPLGEEALNLLDDLRSGDQPWFLHVHFKDPHDPYESGGAWRQEIAGRWDLTSLGLDPSTSEGMSAIAQAWQEADGQTRALIAELVRVAYAADVRDFDAALADFWSDLEATGALDDALVVLWTDHGEQLFDHGELTHDKGLYEEEVAAIAAFQAPGLVPQAWTEPTRHVDLVPTILEMLGLPPEPGLTGKVVGEAGPLRVQPRFMLNDELGAVTSVTVDGTKLIYRWSGVKELYDLRADPLELDDIYDASDPEVQCLWRYLEEEVWKLAPVLTASPQNFHP